ncbi:MAG: GDSL-type esterase/lipase family protein [Reyranellaceae bacterium]
MRAGLILCIVTIAVGLLVAEIVSRLNDPTASILRFPNYIEVYTAPSPEERPQLGYDSMLGYQTLSNVSGTLRGKTASYSAEGTRNHNLGSRPSGPPILAVGDSFTEGYEVANDETWPAHLERDTGRLVYNAGVRGYGLDQIVLRAEQLIPRLKPEAVVLAFIENDIERGGMSVREFRRKPYFVPEGEGLSLRGVPVPTAAFTEPLDHLRHVLGYSKLLDWLMRRLGRFELWYGGVVHTGVDTDLVACRLMDRFAALARQEKVKALVVALPQSDRWTDARNGAARHKRAVAVLACAARAGLATLDTYDGFAAAGAASDVDRFYREWHLTDQGNALAARLIANALATAKD